MVDNKRRLLIVEDDRGLQRQLVWTFDEYDVITATDRESAIAIVQADPPPVITLDLGLPPDPDGASEGLATLERIVEIAPHSKVIVVTGNNQREHALQAVKLGAYDFYRKPVEADTIRLIVERAYNLYELETENRRLHLAGSKSSLDGIITASPGMLRVVAMVERLASSSAGVLLLGESGTGKELIARAIHALSPRSDRRFVATNCAAIPETLLESELFGHEKGAFTGAHRQVMGKLEMANGGTFFLDEVGDMPMSLQPKLLRFLQERKLERIGGRSEIAVDLRIICATHKRPEEMIQSNKFREDLYYRLNEIVIEIPPLRERSGDTLLLARHFFNRMNQQEKRALRGFSANAIGAIERYSWPGNVRELENRVRRAVIMAEGPDITAEDLELQKGPSPSASTTLKEVRGRAERDAVKTALAMAEGNVARAARLLDVSRPTLYDLMRYHGIRI